MTASINSIKTIAIKPIAHKNINRKIYIEVLYNIVNETICLFSEKRRYNHKTDRIDEKLKTYIY